MQDRSHSLGASALFFSLIQGFVKYSSLEWVRWAVGVGMAHRVEQGHEADLGGAQNPIHPRGSGRKQSEFMGNQRCSLH